MEFEIKKFMGAMISGKDFEAQNGLAGKKRVLIVDDHLIVRQGLAHFINKEDDLVVCGGAEDGQQGLSETERLKPDIILLDISLKGMNGIEFLKNVRACHPNLPVIILSMHDESLYAERALRAGAMGYLMKSVSTDDVVAAIRKVLRGEFHISGEAGAAMLKKFLSGRSNGDSTIASLSDRELEVFEMIGAGKTTREVAEALNLSTKTIDAHRMHIKEKLNLRSATELIQHAVRYTEAAVNGRPNSPTSLPN